ncbi:uncharacterized protein PSANT_00030 [Moesziomyces antarcticus]|uniref:Uncharacterized protein n=2 Tax=Pseudozyma antarctica TaxID=84753 RepID=A0A5C3FF76_PSEA2|nr:uncharacterized protein PSANT_00030 [Moesziomyces antarcticus]
MSRFGGRFVPNIEHEVRRQATEPVAKWRQEWVVPSGTSDASSSTAVGVKILKWVRADAFATFPEEQDVQAEDRISDDAAIVEAPVQSIHNAPAVPTPAASLSVSGGLGTIAPKEPAPAVASAIPPHMAQVSEPTSGANTTRGSTPTDSVATPAAGEDSTPAPATTASTAPEAISQAPSSQGEGTAMGTGASTPQLQPQVEAQLHTQPTTAPTTDTATLAVLAAAGGAEHAEMQQQDAAPTTEASSSTDVDMNQA